MRMNIDTTIPPTDITGLILAGGRAERMGGVAKGLLLLDGISLAERVKQRLAPQVGALLISANRPEYAALGLPVVADLLADFPGPLAGLHAGLRMAGTPWLVTAPCDAPFLPDDLVARLAAPYLPYRQCRLFVAVSPRGIEPGFMLCHISLADALERYLATGGRKVRQWLAQMDAGEVSFANAATFANINTPADLANIEDRGRYSPDE